VRLSFLPATLWCLAIEFVNIAEAVDKEILTGRGHLGRRRRPTPLQEIAIACNAGGKIRFSWGKSQEDAFCVRRILGFDHATDSAGFAHLVVRVLYLEHGHGLTECLARRHGADIAARRFLRFEFDVNFSGRVEYNVVERLTMSRICDAVSHVASFEIHPAGPECTRYAQGDCGFGIGV
jgi:hypothetical protein